MAKDAKSRGSEEIMIVGESKFIVCFSMMSPESMSLVDLIIDGDAFSYY